MTLDHLALAACVLAAIPLVNIACNLRLYRRTPRVGKEAAGRSPAASVSVLIPARDEETNIGAAIAAARQSRHPDLEIVVLDDQSRDRTAVIVREQAAEDPRVRLVSGTALPDGWCGKQHACARLAEAARNEVLIFIDADVRLRPSAVPRMVEFLHRRGVDLASGIPRQLTGGLLEKMVIPLIHFVLLGFLPMAGMRRWRGAGWAAGCGQLFVTRRQAYEAAGGHRAIRQSRHDGLMLPRAFRRAGLRTDLFDASDLASCRMYRSAANLWKGLAKNATEGMAAPRAIVPWTGLLLGGQVLPPTLLLLGALLPGSMAIELPLLATGLAYAARGLLTLRFRQPPLGWLLHPLSVAIVVAIQWHALLRVATARPLAWKGRT